MGSKKRRSTVNNNKKARTANNMRRVKRRKGKKTIHYMILFVLIIAAGIVLSLTTLFKIEEITVVSDDRYLAADIINDSGVKLGENLLRVSQDTIEQNLIPKYPYIESISIKRRLPPTLDIIITESIATTAVVEDENIVMLTKDGKILERGKIFIPPKTLIVKGIPTKGIEVGQVLGEKSLEAMRMTRYLIEAIEETEFENITNVDVTNPLDMLIVYENRLLFKMGTEADLAHKLKFIKTVLADMAPDQQGRIDVSNAMNKKWLIVKDITLEQALAMESGEKIEKNMQLTSDETASLDPKSDNSSEIN